MINDQNKGFRNKLFWNLKSENCSLIIEKEKKMQPLFTSKTALLCLISFITAFFISNRFFRGDPAGWKQIISSDGRGYYAYLPALLIDHDLSYIKVIEREKAILGFPDYQPSYLVKVENRAVNKYFAGEALLLLPFFLVAVLFTFFAGLEMNGYSFFFQVFTGIGTLFYLFLGLNYLKKILHHFDIRTSVIAVVLTGILLGTNLFYYSLWQPTMSHIFSFFAINGFLWYCIESIRLFNRRHAAIIGFFLGMVLLIRPTNGVVLFLIPFLFSDFSAMKQFAGTIWKNKPVFLISLFITILILTIQPFLWYLQTGHFFIWSYQDEGFYFSRPEIMNVLFSYRKGLFIYTPLIFFAVFGLFTIIRKPLRFISMLIFFVLSVYLIASWWNWYYGDSFGLRAFIDYYGIYGLLIAMLLNQITIKYQNLLLTFLLVPFIGLNLFQTWQYSNHIIHPNSMNKAKFRYVLLKSDSTYFNCLGATQEIAGYSVDRLHPVMVTQNTFEEPQENWYSTYIKSCANAISGKHANYLDSLNVYSSGFFIRADRISSIPATYYIEGSLSVYDSLPGASNKANLVFSMDSINLRETYWQGFRLNDIPVNPARIWRTCRFSLTLPRILNPDGILKIYIWNFGKKPFMIDDFRLTFNIDQAGSRMN